MYDKSAKKNVGNKKAAATEVAQEDVEEMNDSQYDS